MALVFVVGPPAVGKMTVGHALAARTGLRLFHNHVTSDAVTRLFDYGTPAYGRLVREFRTRVFEEVAASDLPGLVFTYVWAFDDPRDAAFVADLAATFRARGRPVYLAELAAPLAVRLERNATPFRLAEKPTKRDLVASRRHLLDVEGRYQLNSAGALADPAARPAWVDGYVRLDTSALAPEDAAARLAEAFGLPHAAAPGGGAAEARVPDAPSPRPARAAVVVRAEHTADAAALAAYAAVPIAYTVHEALDCAPAGGGLGGLVLTPRTLARPYVKDYDALDGGPVGWAARFGAATVARWGVLAAYASGEPGAPRVGGAVVVHDDPAVHLLEGRRDLAVLWDLRVAPAHRGRGVGRALFATAAAWARARGAGQLKVETQNVNAPACRFYAARGCALGAVHRFAYPGLPDEAQLLWYLDLGAGPGVGALGTAAARRPGRPCSAEWKP